MKYLASAAPDSVAAYGWIPFVVVILGCFLFSTLYMRYFWNKHEQDRVSAVISVLGLTFTLMTSFLLPVDVFLVSFMKNSNGTFKDWATNSTRQTVEDSVSYVYYGLYAIILVFAFFLLPLVYFAYEEKDDEHSNTSQRFCTALKFTFVFVLIAATLLLIGAYVPYSSVPGNSTTWDKFEHVIVDLDKSRIQDALFLVLFVLTTFGMIFMIFYTGMGLSCFPVGLVRGSRKPEDEQSSVREKKFKVQTKISALMEKKQSGKKLSSREQRTLVDLQEEERLMTEQENYLERSQNTRVVFRKLRPMFRVLNIVVGVVGILFGFFLWLSLLLTNIDKLLNSHGYHTGYILKERFLPNPFDFVMVQAQKVFPLDYILFFVIVAFLVVCTVSAIRYFGVWCLCVRMYKIRPHRTQPQGLIILCVILMYTVLAMNILLFSLSPQYTTYGSQHYQVVNETTHTVEVKPCNTEETFDNCVVTRGSFMIMRFFYKAWIFGVAYYWMTWAFLAATVLGFFIAVFRSKHSFLNERFDHDDLEESDDEHLIST